MQPIPSFLFRQLRFRVIVQVMQGEPSLKVAIKLFSSFGFRLYIKPKDVVIIVQHSLLLFGSIFFLFGISWSISLIANSSKSTDSRSLFSTNRIIIDALCLLLKKCLPRYFYTRYAFSFINFQRIQDAAALQVLDSFQFVLCYCKIMKWNHSRTTNSVAIHLKIDAGQKLRRWKKASVVEWVVESIAY